MMTEYTKEVHIAPLQLLVVEFDKPDFTGKVADELDKARDSGLIRVVDGAIIYKDKDGAVTTRQKSDLSFEEIGTYGAVLGALLGVGASDGDEDIARASAGAMRESFEERYQYGLDLEDVTEMVEGLPKNSVTMFLLLEHLWATPLRDALRESGGMLVSQDFLSPELLVSIGRQAKAQTTANV
jgi:uncharacterized membrane protein